MHTKFLNLAKILIGIFFVIYIFNTNSIIASTQSVGINAFPKSYQIYLNQLKKLRPNWTYTALNTGLNWADVIAGEGPSVNLERSAIQLSFADVWKWKNGEGNYNEIEKGWVTASELAVSYTMDPRRYLNEMQIFQFETLNYDSTTQNQNGVEKIFYGTLMYQSTISYIDTNGNTKNIDKTYSQVVMEAAAKYGVSPYHLASRIKQETACDIQNNVSIKGNVSGYVGIYNYFNIGATGGTSPAISGLAYARSAGWTTPELAINGGAEYIAEKYISKGQYTTYLQKFNVNDSSAYRLYTHQYMQNILASSSESVNTYNAYLKMNLLDIPFNFVIPVYNNMPESPVDIYTQNQAEYVKDSTKVYCTSNLNIRAGAGTDYSTILTVAKGTVMTRIARGVQAGERWDKVRLENGIEGYVFQSYIKECSYTKVTGITLDNESVELMPDESITLKANVLPSSATYKEVEFKSSNDNVVTVTEDGKVTGIKEGTAIVTAVTLDQQKEATCIVNVTSKKQTELVIGKESFCILKGKEVNLNVSVLNVLSPELEIAVENNEIVKFDNGKIYGLEEGETKIVISVKNTDLKKEITVKVVELKDGDIAVDSSINVNGDILSNISPETSTQTLLDKFNTNYIVKVKNSLGENLESDSFVGTGSTVQILNADSLVIYEYTIAIYGDITGDGKITSKDYMSIKNYIMGSLKLDNLQLKVADSFSDGKINSKDYMLIKNYIMGISQIEQRR